jgi:ribose transport system permease protein
MSSDPTMMSAAAVTAPPDVPPKTPAPTGPGSRSRGSAVLGAAGFLRRYATVVLLIALIVIFTILNSDFLTAKNWTDLLITQAVIACIGFAALFPLIVGEFDLSLGYLAGLITMVGAYLAGKGGGAFEVIVAMVACGVLAGLINGILTVRFQISSFISTLGVGIICSGLTLAISNGQVLFSGVPPLITNIGRDHLLGVAIAVWLVVVIAIILQYLLEHTPVGRQWYAVGGSERVAFLAGLPTKRLKVLAFVMAGILVAIASLFSLGTSGAANPSFGPELLLPAYASAFLGVTTYRLGYYNVPGTVVAILVLAVGFNGLSLLGVPFWGQPLFNGAVLLVAVLAARAEARHVRVG